MIYLRLLHRIAKELFVTSRFSYQHSTLGTITLDQEQKATPESMDTTLFLEKDLSQLIYYYYNLCDMREVQHFLQREQKELTPILLRENPSFGKQLREANQGQGYYSSSWKIVQIEDAGIEVAKDGLHLYAQPQEIAASTLPLRRGDIVALHFPKDRPYASPGYYTFLSNKGGIESKSGLLVRFYFHLHADFAPLAVKTLTTMLQTNHIRYSAKILNNPANYTRPDTLVLYLSGKDVPHTYTLLKKIYAHLSKGFLPSVPAFTKPLAAGFGVAEEPTDASDTSLSFGQHRATMVARGLIHAWQKDQNNSKGRYTGILEAFNAQKIDPARPYLNKASSDIYDLFEDEKTRGR